MGSGRYFRQLCISNVILTAGVLAVSAVAAVFLQRENFPSGTVVFCAILVLLGLCALISWLDYRRYLRPLEEIRRVALESASGRFDLRAHTNQSQELREFAEAVNSMASQLEQRLSNLRSQKEEREAILSSMLEGVIAVDREDRIIRFNRAAASFLGVLQEESEGRSVFEVVRSAPLQQLIRDVTAARGPLEREIHLIQGQERCLEVSGRPLHSPSGNELGLLLVLHDVTAMRKLENLRRDFVANVSHELRTPITSIKAAAETLLDGALARPEDARSFASMIVRHADRLNCIIQDLLRLASLENMKSREEIFFEPLRVESFLRQALEDCKENAANRNVRLLCSGDSTLPVRGNLTLLTQALVNLISNAVEYSDSCSSVQISCSSQGGKVVISVADRGCGIEPVHLQRIFERFYRVDKARSRKSGGTGLGLAIVKHVAEAHGGSVSVQSSPGEGSVFSLILPGLQTADTIV